MFILFVIFNMQEGEFWGEGGLSYRIVLNVDLQFYINVLFIVISLELTPFIMLHDAEL